MALIRHRALGRTVEVPDRTVHIWERSGWKAVTPTRSPSTPLVEPDAPDEGDPDPLTKED